MKSVKYAIIIMFTIFTQSIFIVSYPLYKQLEIKISSIKLNYKNKKS
jgi:hypothetical protein